MACYAYYVIFCMHAPTLQDGLLTCMLDYVHWTKPASSRRQHMFFAQLVWHSWANELRCAGCLLAACAARHCYAHGRPTHLGQPLLAHSEHMNGTRQAGLVGGLKERGGRMCRAHAAAVPQTTDSLIVAIVASANRRHCSLCRGSRGTGYGRFAEHDTVGRVAVRHGTYGVHGPLMTACERYAAMRHTRLVFTYLGCNTLASSHFVSRFSLPVHTQRVTMPWSAH